MQELSHCKLFIIFRATEKVVINKLGLTQTEFSSGAKVVFHMHKYFSSEDLDFINPTKLGLHFLDFSTI